LPNILPPSAAVEKLAHLFVVIDRMILIRGDDDVMNRLMIITGKCLFIFLQSEFDVFFGGGMSLEPFLTNDSQ
jgi:hypothetical protein